MAEHKVCKHYNEAGECIGWENVGDTPILTITKEAKSCATPTMLKEAKERLKRMKVLIPDD